MGSHEPYNKFCCKAFFIPKQCEWANILDVSFDMDVSDIILGDFSKAKMYKLNEFLDLNSSIKNQSLYEFKCRILLNKLNKKGLI